MTRNKEGVDSKVAANTETGILDGTELMTEGV